MEISGGVKIIIVFTAILVLLLLWMMVMIYRRRHQIIKMNWLVNGTVIDIVKRRGYRADYYVSSIEYMHHKLGKIRTQRFSSRHPRRYAKGSEVPLYYHTHKPEKIVLEEDTTTKVALYVLGLFAIAILVLGFLGARFLLIYGYTDQA